MEKKIPLRQCVICRNMMPKKELYRIVKTADNEIIVDKANKFQGRGAYICRDVNCINLLNKRKALNKVFGMTISENVYERISKELINE